MNVFRKESYKNEDVILEQLMKPGDMVYLFGDYNMFIFGKETKNDYCTLEK